MMSWIGRVAVLSALTTAACASAPAAPAPQQQEPMGPPDPLTSYLENATLREIGPAIMGGRVTSLAVDESNPATFYVGFATAGLWKTTSDGMEWTPVFDDQPNASIGDVALAPSNPNVVWVGTGEPQNRQSSPYGEGVFRSMDGGRTWSHLGLTDTKHIARIVVHPTDPDVAWVAAMGHLWGPNEERGVFRTTDGGRTWAKVLYVDENTGAIDLAIDPGDPNTLFAATYQRQRTGFAYSSNGPGSGIHRTHDGGATWERLEGGGLPDGEFGRVGLAVYRGDGNLVYATIEADPGPRGGRGLYRSTDRGNTWERMSTRNPRPMYFSLVRIDPTDPERIYLGGVALSISEDGGRTWREGDAAETIHVDHHEVWINPNDPGHVILGSDGGVSATRNGGHNWRMYDNMAIGQFYEIGYDMQDPYHVCGGLQDNSSWCAPNQTLDVYGVMNQDWEDVSGGDGFYNQVDPTDANIVYTESQNGNLIRRNRATGEAQRIRPFARPTPEDDDRSYRFNWNAPIVISAHDPSTILFGANHLMRSRDRGVTWEEASPDLTKQIDRDTLFVMGRSLSEPQRSRNEWPGSYGNITTISESPISADVVYVGTDDGNLQVTRDGGATWTNVVGNVPDLPERTYVSRLEASHHEAGRVYVSFDGHRNDDYAAWAFVSEDFGASWTRITNGLPEHSINAIREHHETPELLFVSNEVGVFTSVNRGASWHRLHGNFPTVPVDDIAIHPRENDLIVGTHGRSIWILHDLSPLEVMANGQPGGVLASTLFPAKDATMWSRAGGWLFWGDQFIAENPEDGVHLRFYVGEDILAMGMMAGGGMEMGGGMEGDMGARHTEHMADPEHRARHMRMHPPTVTITDADGTVIRTLEGEGRMGYQEMVWDFRHEPPYEIEGQQGGFFGPPRGPRVLPGTYTATLAVGGGESSTSFEVRLDPRITVSRADLMTRQEALLTLYDMAKPVRDGQDALRRIRGQLSDAESLVNEVEAAPEDVAEQIDSIQARVEEIGEDLGPLQGVIRLANAIDGSTTAPTADELWRIDRGWDDMVEVLERLNEVIETDLPVLYDAMNEAGLRPEPGEAITVPRRSGGG